MKSQIPHFRLILPTDELVEEYRQTDTLLSLVQADTRQIMRYVADYYLHHDALFDSMGYARLQELLGFIQTDFLYDFRHERHDNRDVRDIRTILITLATALYDLMDNVITQQRLPDQVMRDLDIEGWLGDSMIVSTEKDGFNSWKDPGTPSFRMRKEIPFFSNGGW